MLTVNIGGNTLQDVAREALDFANLVLGLSGNDRSWEGYHPNGVGKSEYRPVDDGREWGEDALGEWIRNLNENGRKVVEILARKKIMDQREQARNLGWSGSEWAGVWTGPRRQARYVMDNHGLSSWPYGHTYEEPRRMWMHESIANRVLSVIEQLINMD